MAHNPKLEVVTFRLSPKDSSSVSFREFFLSKLYSNDSEREDLDDAVIFLDYFKKFIHEVDGNNFILNGRKQKGFTAYDAREPGTAEPTINIASEHHLVYGTVSGGRYGQRRKKSNTEAKGEKELLNRRAIIMDDYFFMIYTPIWSNLGVMLIQSYSSDSISDIFKEFIAKFFSGAKFHLAKTDRFVPKAIVDEFKTGSVASKFKYSTRTVSRDFTESSIGEEPQEFVIRIEAEVKNGVDRSQLDEFLEKFRSLTFWNKSLSTYDENIQLKNEVTNATTTWEYKAGLEIQPTIYLENRIPIDEDGIPNFEALNIYCGRLLFDEIIPELYPGNEFINR